MEDRGVEDEDRARQGRKKTVSVSYFSVPRSHGQVPTLKRPILLSLMQYIYIVNIYI